MELDPTAVERAADRARRRRAFTDGPRRWRQVSHGGGPVRGARTRLRVCGWFGSPNGAESEPARAKDALLLSQVAAKK